MKNLFFLFFYFFSLFNDVHAARNPFCFATPEPQIMAIGLLEPHHEHFALISINKKFFTVFLGNSFEGYLVTLIEEKSVTLKNIKNKKALQLKI